MLIRERHLFDIMDQGGRAYSEGGVLIRAVCAHSGGVALIRGGEGAYSRKYRNCMIASNTPAK